MLESTVLLKRNGGQTSPLPGAPKFGEDQGTASACLTPVSLLGLLSICFEPCF